MSGVVRRGFRTWFGRVIGDGGCVIYTCNMLCCVVFFVYCEVYGVRRVSHIVRCSLYIGCRIVCDMGVV